MNSVRDAINVSNPNIIIHAAATKFVQLSEKFPFECIDTNVLGSANIARAAIEKKVKTVIGISTDKSAQPIENIYGHSKAIMERIFVASNKISQSKFICLRFGNIAWSTGSVFPLWKEMFSKKKQIFTTGPFMRRFIFSVKDAVNLVNLSINKSKLFQGKIICPEMKSAKMIDILKQWTKIYGGTYRIIKKRVGDKNDEILIGENEIKSTTVVKYNKKKYYLIDPYSNKNISLKKKIDTKNSKKLSKIEVTKLIKLGF